MGPHLQVLSDLVDIGLLDENDMRRYIARQDEAIAQAARRKMAALDCLKVLNRGASAPADTEAGALVSDGTR